MQRELQQRTAVIAALAGVNERTQKTDLQQQEFVNVEGSFPYQTGHQQKILGKILLGKFDEAVYGIHQFWSPYGYGPNIYQFDGNIGVDPWITPPGGPIVLPDILPTPIWDDDFIIVDELGNNPSIPGGGTTVEYVDSGGGNGTESTPGNPPKDPPPAPPDFILRNRSFFVSFPVGGSLRSLRDILHIRFSLDDPTILHTGSPTPDGSNAGNFVYTHPSGDYTAVSYEILTRDPPVEPSPTVGVNPADQGGFCIYNHYLVENASELVIVTNTWN